MQKKGKKAEKQKQQQKDKQADMKWQSGTVCKPSWILTLCDFHQARDLERVLTPFLLLAADVTALR